MDESGDTGRRITNNSSRYLVAAIVIFKDDADAQACDNAIERLRPDFHLRPDYEFHYAHNSPKIKEALLRRVSLHLFDYIAFAINKDPQQMSNEEMEYGNGLYRFAILRILELSLPYLDNATVAIDNSGERKSKDRLTSYLRQNLRRLDEDRTVRKTKMQDSAGNNLLQLADYIAGIVNRSLQGKPREIDFLHRYLMPHEISRVLWP